MCMTLGPLLISLLVGFPGISLDCAAQIFKIWLQEKDVREVFSALKKVQIDTRLQVWVSCSLPVCICERVHMVKDASGMQSNAFTEDARSVQTCKTTLSQRVLEVCKHAK